MEAWWYNIPTSHDWNIHAYTFNHAFNLAAPVQYICYIIEKDIEGLLKLIILIEKKKKKTAYRSSSPCHKIKPPLPI